MNHYPSLTDFHSIIMGKMSGFRIPDELKAKCNQEFRAYLDGQEGSQYYKWLALAIAEHQPEVILELGTNRGASAIAMWSQKRKDAILVTVDIQDCGPYFPWQMEQDKRFYFQIGDDLDPSSWMDLGRVPILDQLGIDFLFIDTDHRSDHFRKEWAIYRKWLADGAIVAVDDINVNDMREAWDELPYEKLDISADCHYSGFGVLRYRK